jgi:hypothetical protein
VIVDGHNDTVDSRSRFLCGGYNSTSTPVVRTDGHVDAVGSLVICCGHNGTVRLLGSSHCRCGDSLL